MDNRVSKSAGKKPLSRLPVVKEQRVDGTGYIIYLYFIYLRCTLDGHEKW